MKKKAAIIGFSALAIFLIWRFIRPMNIFVVSEAFERPIHVAEIPKPLKSLSAKECAQCHRRIYDEWATSMHAKAWTDPYFQVDFRFDGSQQICKNCHIPLENQQEHLVLGFRDSEKWKPILKPNPHFDPDLQNEGINCTVCHVKDGKILGPRGGTSAPHPVVKMENPNLACVRCHVVEGNRWDTFYRIPPCGTVAEIESAGGDPLSCVECHMPRHESSDEWDSSHRRHLWRGGHDPETVKSALEAFLKEVESPSPKKLRYSLTLSNKGAAHYLPTGTPDRHLTVDLRLLDAQDNVLKQKTRKLKRTIMWRPFIVDLRDTRLPKGERRTYDFTFTRHPAAKAVEAVVRYHLLDEKQREKIGYENKEPISYEIYRERIPVK